MMVGPETMETYQRRSNEAVARVMGGVLPINWDLVDQDGEIRDVLLDAQYTIAQYFEDPERRGSLRDHEREFVKERLAVLPFLDVEKINEMFNSASAEEESRFAYFFAKSFVALLVRKEGEYSLRRVLDELKRGSGIEDISMKIYYNSLRGLLSEWRNSLG